MDMGVYQRVGSALEQFDLRFMPVYLAVGMFVLLLQLCVVVGVARTVYRESGMTMANVTPAFLHAQRLFYFLAVAVPVLMTTIEDNAVVFGAIFAFPFVVVAGLFAVQRMRRSLRALGRRARRQQPRLRAPQSFLRRSRPPQATGTTAPRARLPEPLHWP